jgi:hypothetical protein
MRGDAATAGAPPPADSAFLDDEIATTYQRALDALDRDVLLNPAPYDRRPARNPYPPILAETNRKLRDAAVSRRDAANLLRGCGLIGLTGANRPLTFQR